MQDQVIKTKSPLGNYLPSAELILFLVVATTLAVGLHQCVPPAFFFPGFSRHNLLAWLALAFHGAAMHICFQEQDRGRINIFPKPGGGMISIPAPPPFKLPLEVKEIMVAVLELISLTMLIYSTGGIDSPFESFYPAFPVVFSMVVHSRRVAIMTFIGTAISFVLTLYKCNPVIDLVSGKGIHPVEYRLLMLIVFWGTIAVTAIQVLADFRGKDPLPQNPLQKAAAATGD